MKFLMPMLLAAGFLGCSPGPRSQGGEFDATMLRYESTGQTTPARVPPSAPWRTRRPEPEPLLSPEIPDLRDDEEEDFFMPKRYQTLHI